MFPTFISSKHVFLFSRKYQHIFFWAHPAVKVHQVNCSRAVSSSAPEKMNAPTPSQPNAIWSSYDSETSYSSRMICAAPVVAAHHLPAGHGGQRSRPTVDVQSQRWTGIRRRAGAGEPSSLADAPVLCRAVGGGEASRRKRRRRRSERAT